MCSTTSDTSIINSLTTALDISEELQCSPCNLFTPFDDFQHVRCNGENLMDILDKPTVLWQKKYKNKSIEDYNERNFDGAEQKECFVVTFGTSESAVKRLNDRDYEQEAIDKYLLGEIDNITSYYIESQVLGDILNTMPDYNLVFKIINYDSENNTDHWSLTSSKGVIESLGMMSGVIKEDFETDFLAGSCKIIGLSGHLPSYSDVVDCI